MKRIYICCALISALTFIPILTACNNPTGQEDVFQICQFPSDLLGEWYDDPTDGWNYSVRNIPPYRIRTGNIFYWVQTSHYNGSRYRILTERDTTDEKHTFFFDNLTATTMDANHTIGNVWIPAGGFTGHHK